jgi:phage terminase small subunit
MLNGRQRKFCEGIARGLNGTEAYHEAYPGACHQSASQIGSRLMRKDEVKAEIARLRAAADVAAGSAVLDCVEKRVFCARAVHANLATLDPVLDGDLLVVCKTRHGRRRLRIVNKVRAIELDNELAGEAAQAKPNDQLRPWPPAQKPSSGGGTPSPTLSGPQRKFCEGIVRGLSVTEAYGQAYPRSTRRSACRSGCQLLKDGEVIAEIARLRAAAAKIAGPRLLQTPEKRVFLARHVRANPVNLDPVRDGDLLQVFEVDKEGNLDWQLGDKLHAIKVDNDLARESAPADENDELAAMIKRIMLESIPLRKRNSSNTPGTVPVPSATEAPGNQGPASSGRQPVGNGIPSLCDPNNSF